MTAWQTAAVRMLLVLVTTGLACSRQAEESVQAPHVGARSEKLGPGVFRLSTLGRTAEGSMRYLAQADSADAPCKFEIVIGDTKPSDGNPIALAAASIVRHPGSDCTDFLRALAPALAFKGPLPGPQSVQRLDGSIAVLGSSLSRRSDHHEDAVSFTSEPPGPWLSTKLFLADGEAEVFLNLDVPEGLGELSIKDEDYAVIVVTELAKVLLPERRSA